MLNNLISTFSRRSRIETARKKLYQAAYSWCHDRALAEDLVQDTLLKALANSSSLRKPQYLDTWLFRILVNNWHDYLRGKKDHLALDEYRFTSNADVERDYLRGELVTRVRQEISRLPMTLREIITLSDFSGLSYQQMAEVLDIPIGTVMSRLFRARKLLEKGLIDVKSPSAEVTYLRKVK